MFYSVDMLRTSSLAGSISSNSEKTAPRSNVPCFLNTVLRHGTFFFKTSFKGIFTKEQNYH